MIIFKDILTFARCMELSEGYLDGCFEYIFQFNRKNRWQNRAIKTGPIFYGNYVCNANNYPDVNIKNLTREEIIAMNLPCRSIYESINAGYLEKVNDYNKLVDII